MALKTLGELNKDFIDGCESSARRSYYEPITPIVIDVLLPGPSEGKRKAIPAFRETFGGDAGNSAPGEKQAKRRSRDVFAFISNIVFYLAVVMIMITVLTSGTENGAPKTIFGYSYFTVISKSMQDEIPKGSFILVKDRDAKSLKVGDTITYIRDRNTSVTHKIVDIFENYNKSGARGFQTKGVNNANPDSDIVYEANIVGKVILAIPVLGAAMSWLAANVYLVFVIFGLCVIISFCIRGLLVKPVRRKAREAG